jgi:hypothetical protein
MMPSDSNTKFEHETRKLKKSDQKKLTVKLSKTSFFFTEPTSMAVFQNSDCMRGFQDQTRLEGNHGYDGD